MGALARQTDTRGDLAGRGLHKMAANAEQMPLWAWAAFAALVIVLLAVDLFTTSGERAESRGWALGWSVVWIGTGLAFSGLVYLLKDFAATSEYLTVFLLEKSLSLDNLFVFLIIFGALGIPKRYQHRALFWGIIGAVVFRGIFILVGAAALDRYQWVVYIFAAILAYAAWQTLRKDPTQAQENKSLKWLSRHLPISEQSHSGQFVARHDGKWVLTSVGLALIAVELSDIMFAVDSIAAALSYTQDRFVLYSANIFAVLGLRALYLLLAHLIRDWPYLHYGIAAVLAFTAVKLLTEPWFEIPLWISLLFIVGSITTAILASTKWAPSARANSKDIPRS